MHHTSFTHSLPFTATQVGSYRLSAPTTAGVKPSDGWATGLLNKTSLQFAAMQVGSYRLTAPTTAGVKPSDGWATGLGAVRQFNLTRNSQTTTLCFSRPVSSAAALTSSINPAGRKPEARV